MILRSITTLMFIVALSACASVITPDINTSASALRKGTYTLDQSHASLIFKINHLGFSTYVGRFETLDASLDFDSKNPEKAALSARVDMTSLDIANDDFAATLMGPDWFDSARFPYATFTSDEIIITGDQTGLIKGSLTLHGVTNPVTLSVRFNGGARDILRSAYVVGFSATGTLDRTDFGVSKFSGVVTDEVTLEIEAEFLRQ